jgi:hypothetical protein
VKPGLFQSWKEAAIKLSLAVIFAVCIGTLVLWALGIVTV